MKKLLLFSLALVLVAGLFGLSGAVSRGKGMGKGTERDCMDKGCEMCMHDGPMMGKLKSLGLDEKQIEDIKALHLRTKKDMIKKNAELEVAELELREMLHKDQVDMSAAEAKVKQIESMKSDIKIAHIRTLEEVKSKMTPEQRKKFGAMMMEGKHMDGKGGKKHSKCDMMPDDRGPAEQGKRPMPGAGK